MKTDLYHYVNVTAAEIFNLIGDTSWKEKADIVDRKGGGTEVHFRNGAVVPLKFWMHRTPEENFGLAVHFKMELDQC